MKAYALCSSLFGVLFAQQAVDGLPANWPTNVGLLTAFVITVYIFVQRDREKDKDVVAKLAAQIDDSVKKNTEALGKLASEHERVNNQNMHTVRGMGEEHNKLMNRALNVIESHERRIMAVEVRVGHLTANKITTGAIEHTQFHQIEAKEVGQSNPDPN